MKQLNISFIVFAEIQKSLKVYILISNENVPPTKV